MEVPDVNTTTDYAFLIRTTENTVNYDKLITISVVDCTIEYCKECDVDDPRI
jgi:hypothetical protein